MILQNSQTATYRNLLCNKKKLCIILLMNIRIKLNFQGLVNQFRNPNPASINTVRTRPSICTHWMNQIQKLTHLVQTVQLIPSIKSTKVH